MPETKDAFVCYRSYIEAIRLLPEDKRWGYFESIMLYALDNAEPTFSENIESAIFTLMKANLDSCNKRYSSSVENGKKGGAPKGNNNAKTFKKTTQQQPNSTQNNPNGNVNANDTLLSVSEGGGLKPPPPSAEDKFEMNGKSYEYYIAGDGERRVREIDRKPQ